jgi:hypothetical protein
MTGAELLVRCLANEGLQHMFGVPGEETSPYWRPSLIPRSIFSRRATSRGGFHGQRPGPAHRQGENLRLTEKLGAWVCP